MSLDIKKLSVVSYANGFTIWHYKTETDKMEVVKGEKINKNAKEKGYFDSVESILIENDLIITTALDTTQFLIVSENKNGKVKVNEIGVKK